MNTDETRMKTEAEIRRRLRLPVFLSVFHPCSSVARFFGVSTMSVILSSTATSAAFAARVAAALGVSVAAAEPRPFPDGDTSLRLPLEDRSGFIGHDVVLAGATESLTSIDELYRLGCAAVKYG